MLKKELAAKLSGLRDEERDRLAVRHAWPSDSLYTGPYLNAAPDVIVGIRGWLSRIVGRCGRQGDADRVQRTTPRRGAATIASTRTWFPA